METVSTLFLQILNMSLTASIVMAAVLGIRFLIRGWPRIFSYVLWSVVFFRLLCPVSISVAFSPLGLLHPAVEEQNTVTSMVEFLPEEVLPVELPQTTEITETPPTVQLESQTRINPISMFSMVWLAGVGAMIGYSILSNLRLRRTLTAAVPAEKGIYLADYIGTPFVLGLFRPRIYLPSFLEGNEREYILLHEKHHLKRLDYIWKVISFTALAVHWFNPLVWLAFTLMSKDMEMSCDEAVIGKLGAQIRSDYSASLLRLASGRPLVSGTPLAFGEGDAKGRVMNVLNWKKPKAWMMAAGTLCCMVVLISCGVNPDSVATAPEPDALLKLDTLEAALEKSPWNCFVPEDEIAVGQESIRYSIRDSERTVGADHTGGKLLLAAIMSHYFEEERILTAQFLPEGNPGADGDEDEVFTWEAVKEQILFAAELYGGINGEGLVKKLSEQEFTGKPWVAVAEVPGGCCEVKVIERPAPPANHHCYVDHASYQLTVTFCPSREVYDAYLKNVMETRQEIKENPDAWKENLMKLADIWTVQSGDDTKLVLVNGEDRQEIRDCWSGGTSWFEMLTSMDMYPHGEHPLHMPGKQIVLQKDELTLTVWEEVPWFTIVQTGEEELWLRSMGDTDIYDVLDEWAASALAHE